MRTFIYFDKWKQVLSIGTIYLLAPETRADPHLNGCFRRSLETEVYTECGCFLYKIIILMFVALVFVLINVYYYIINF